MDEWDTRPETTPPVNPAQIPLALCAILYSYEGINLILPVESAMRNPQHFAPVFCASMAVVALILATVAVVCVYAFGNVTSGSVTAFLLAQYKDDDSVTTWIMIANTAVSLSVLLTYPLQLFPALELLGPLLEQNKFLTKVLCLPAKGDDDEDDNQDLGGFEPLPMLPEHDIMDEEDMAEYNTEQNYYHSAEEIAEQKLAAASGAGDQDGGDGDNIDNNKNDDEFDDKSFGGMSSVSGMSLFPKLQNGMPGDSVQLRLALVVLTYLVAVVVPNVQALISLAGALAGSSTALLIPPVLELAWMEHLEQHSAMSKDNSSAPMPQSPHMMRVKAIQQAQAQAAQAAASGSIKKKDHSATNAIIQQWFSSKYWVEQLKCYVLLSLGFVFMLIGTYASIADIVKIYLGK